MHLTGTWIQLINGIILLSTFFGSRLVYGTILVRSPNFRRQTIIYHAINKSYQFFHTVYDIRNDLSTTNIIVYCVGNVMLNMLNWFWYVVAYFFGTLKIPYDDSL